MNKKLFWQILLGGSVLILFGYVLWNLDDVSKLLSGFMLLLRPIIIGCGLAFILNSPYRKIQKLYRRIKKERLRNILALLTVYLAFLIIIAAIIGFVIPQIIDSVNLLISNLDSYYKNLTTLFDKISNTADFEILKELQIKEKLLGFLSELPALMKNVGAQVLSFTTNLIKGITDLFLGFMISIYILSDKERLKSQFRRLIDAYLPPKACRKIHNMWAMTSQTFSNFISGQLTEACILGILCFIGMTIFGFEYAFLISVIVAVTNLIPIVGPIIGAVPSTFILLLVNPIRAVWFVVFIIILQQIEANLIYPKVVGTSVGLPSLWVLVAVIVGGGLFGVLGMILGIPAASILYELTGTAVKKRNQMKNNMKRDSFLRNDFKKQDSL